MMVGDLKFMDFGPEVSSSRSVIKNLFQRL